MNRPRLIRVLRTTWAALFGVLGVLLFVLLVRSYRGMDSVQIRGNRIVVADGNLFINELIAFNEGPSSVGYTAAGVGYKIRMWVPTLFAATLAVIPWVGWQFSLRTLLIATTLIAVILGLTAAYLRLW